MPNIYIKCADLASKLTLEIIQNKSIHAKI